MIYELHLNKAEQQQIFISIRDVHHEEFSPFVNFDVEISPTIDSTGKHQTIGIKLIIKADKATHIPSMETISHLIREVHGMAIKNFVAK